jgi:hypothetical protein
MRSKDFFQWFAVIGAIVYGIYLFASYADGRYASKDAFDQMNERTGRIENKVDQLLERPHSDQ